MQIQAVKEAGVKIRNSDDVVNALVDDFKTELRELFGALYLNTKNVIVHSEIISMGSLNASIVHPREFFKPAILNSAAAVIAVHNHPSGDPAPSSDDIELTKRLTEAGEILGIKLLDHIVLGGGGFISMKERGLGV